MLKRFFVTMLMLALLLQFYNIPIFAEDSITSISAPINLKAELRVGTDGLPYFYLTLEVPDSVRILNENLIEDNLYYEGYASDGLAIQFDFRYADYDWNEGPTQTWNTEDSLSEFLDRGGYWEYEPFDAGDGDTININSEVYYFRAKFLLNWGPVDSNGEIGWIDQYTYSQYSNTVMIGNPSYYEDASDWAVDEIEEAGSAGLIPDILLGADMKKPITREEFCELAVLLYDKIALIPSVPYPNNPFVDTQNPQILKAYQLGITKGVSETKFEPNTLINREQCATMLFRAIQAMFPEENYEIEEVSDFADQAHISSWAVAGTKYMYKLGIIKGDSKGNFMPKAISTADVSIGYGMATREAAILMSIRTYNQVGEP